MALLAGIRLIQAVPDGAIYFFIGGAIMIFAGLKQRELYQKQMRSAVGGYHSPSPQATKPSGPPHSPNSPPMYQAAPRVPNSPPNFGDRAPGAATLCPSCGAVNPPRGKAVFCEYCGTRLP